MKIDNPNNKIIDMINKNSIEYRISHEKISINWTHEKDIFILLIIIERTLKDVGGTL